MNIQKSAQKGFTLIELMIVIAIVGILAAIALPAYQDYTVRAKMAEPLARLAEAKTTISEFYVANNDIPANGESGISTNGTRDIIQQVTYANTASGPIVAIAVQATIIPGGGTDLWFAMSGLTNTDGTITWTCIPGDLAGANGLERKYLPANCRG